MESYINGTKDEFDKLPTGLTLIYVSSSSQHESLVDYVFERWDRNQSGGLINVDRSLLGWNEMMTLIRLSVKNQDKGGFLGVTKFEKIIEGRRPASKLRYLNETARTSGVTVVMTLITSPGESLPPWAMEVATKVVRM